MASTEPFPVISPGGGLLISYQLKGKRVLIVGGGPVAAGRLVNVKDADAHVTVIAPRAGLCREMRFRIEEEKSVDQYYDRYFSTPEEELDDTADLTAPVPEPVPGQAPRVKYDLVLTAIDNSEVSRRICQSCRARRIPVNVADVPPECDFYFGSLIRRGPLQVMVSTGGKGPKLAALIRQRIEAALPQEVGPAIEKVGRLRLALRQVAPSPQEGKQRMGWMSSVCTAWSFEDLAQLDDEQIQVLLRDGFQAERSVPTRDEVLTQLTSPSSSGPSPRTARRTHGHWASLSTHVSELLTSPWAAGLIGALAGTTATACLIFARDAHRP